MSTALRTVSCRDQYRQALTYLVQKEPFYYHFISQLRYREVERIGGGASAAISYENGVFILALDQQLFPKNDLEVAAAILCHETMHFIFQHLSSPFIEQNSTIWNWATDIAINSLISYRLWDYALTADSVKTALNIVEDFPPAKSALFYYSILLNYQDQIDKRTGGQPGEGESMASFENHEGWGDSLTPEQRKTATYRLARMAKDSLQKSNNRLPGTMRGAIEELIQALAPLVDWRKTLRNWTGRCGGFELLQTNARANKYGNYPRTTMLPGSKLLVAIDTSASVSDKLLSQFLGELEGIAKYKNVETIQIDTEVHGKPEPFRRKNLHKYEIRGRGGTHLPRIFDYLNDNKLTYDGIIILTDMGTAFPTREQVRHRKVLWVDASNDSDWGWGSFPHSTGIGTVLKLF